MSYSFLVPLTFSEGRLQMLLLGTKWINTCFKILIVFCSTVTLGFFSRTPFWWVKMSHSQSICVSIFYTTALVTLAFSLNNSSPSLVLRFGCICTQQSDFLTASVSEKLRFISLLPLGNFSISLMTQGSECCTMLQTRFYQCLGLLNY